ncbi:MAG: shikimate dehydrogenase [Acetobacteraceae bacterium]
MPILSARARVAGLVGWPVAHSRSPRLQNFWLERHGIDGAYVPLAVPPASLPAAIRGLAAAGFAGCNVTIPHKEAAAGLCDSVTDAARRIGAVNTLVFHNGKIDGSSTDGEAFLANLRAHGVDPAAGPALVLGAGGAARAVVAALLDAGAHVSITNRTSGRAEALCRVFPALTPLPWEARSAALAGQALLVNTTAAGMQGRPPFDLDLGAADARLTVADLVYAPPETPLLARAKIRGLKIVPGLGMLLHQAVPGFEAWFGVRPVVDPEVIAFVAASLAADWAPGAPQGRTAEQDRGTNPGRANYGRMT